MLLGNSGLAKGKPYHSLQGPSKTDLVAHLVAIGNDPRELLEGSVAVPLEINLRQLARTELFETFQELSLSVHASASGGKAALGTSLLRTGGRYKASRRRMRI